MPRHATYVPHGVIPAVLLPFENDLSIDERNFRKHLRDVAAVEGLSAVTVNAHSTEVASCSFDEQRRVLDIAQEEIGDRVPLVNGVWADGSLEAARIAHASDIPIIAFQYPLSTGQGYPLDTLLKIVEQVPTVRAIKDWAGNVPQHETHIR